MAVSNQSKVAQCPYCKSIAPLGASKCAQCGEFITRKMSFLLGAGIFLFPIIFAWFTLRKGYSTLARIITFVWLIILLLVFFADNGNLKSLSHHTSSSNSSNTPSIQLTSLMPTSEKQFIDTINEYAALYNQADNELKKSIVWKQRDAAIRKLSLTPTGENENGWVGIIESLGTNGEGKAYIAIRISDKIVVKTWSNAFSDISDNTLIPQSSPLYNILAELKTGARVQFSARLISYANLTEAGKMNDPELISRFNTIKSI